MIRSVPGVGKGHTPQPKQGTYTLPAKGYARDGHTAARWSAWLTLAGFWVQFLGAINSKSL